MNYFQPYALAPDETIVAAWDSQMVEAAETPWLANALAAQSADLFPRFSACYAQLRALPRGARRALQRQLARSGEPAEFLPDWLQGQVGRALQQKLARSLAGAALLLALGQGLAQAATINVTAKTPPVINDGDLKCSLIEAIENANDTSTGQPHIDCAAGDPLGADTIVLPAKSSHSLTSINNSTYGPTGLPVITSEITISGTSAKITRSKNAPAFRLMAVGSTGDLTLQGVTLSGGLLTGYDGGAIYNYGYLTINNSTITGNKADNGGGIFNHGTLTIDPTTISKNTATGAGGGIYSYGDSSTTNTITNSTITGNTAFAGGGIFNNSYLTLTGGSITKNTSYYGGGALNNYDGTLTVTNSTISGNTAKLKTVKVKYGPYTYTYFYGGYGGGMLNLGSLAIYNSTITGNSAKGKITKVKYYGTTYIYYNHGFGGGILNTGYLYTSGGTITKNTALVGGGLFDYGSSNIIGTIITGNKASLGPDIFP